MKKSISNLGEILNKDELKSINGSVIIACYTHSECPRNMGCCKKPPYIGLCMEGEDYRRICNN
ncbi:hypothetical protein C7448_11056 [Tenacibaculum gallaicum]|uniref:Uncharacterized protein n=1 Tax=Tenacibaculum gallaicum TaxID=561505 RepID=A0A3E0HGZ8_9FLAO|nr:hypothetical protein [Tenacibaculum gallaicum]REH45028.1 hypothetical protein C7448_11056 [Tenacibaculum gallaicum]